MPSPIRVLIADDQRAFADALEALLGSESGIVVVGRAQDGSEAVELAERLRPDVVLMDISMPRVDGVEATRRIRDENESIRVLMLTGSDSSEDVDRARKAGAVAYITKDRLGEPLVEAIRAARGDA